MKVLALESSSAVASAAIVDEHKLVAECILNHKKTHSQKLLPMVEKVLDSAELRVQDIDAFAVAYGPGSFTGLRIGVCTVKALAQAFNKPVIGVSTLDGLAYNMACATGLICPIMDARRDQVYTSIYKWDCHGLHRLDEYMAIPVNNLVDMLKKWDKPVSFCGDGVFVYRDVVQEEMKDRAIFAPPTHVMQRASSIAWLGLKKVLKGCTQNYWELQPFYLRKSQAEQKFDKRRKIEEAKR
jgi:tRNA threonylcarbamoyladenosine biosynthesis protein TsaB